MVSLFGPNSIRLLWLPCMGHWLNPVVIRRQLTKSFAGTLTLLLTEVDCVNMNTAGRNLFTILPLEHHSVLGVVSSTKMYLQATMTPTFGSVVLHWQSTTRPPVMYGFCCNSYTNYWLHCRSECQCWCQSRWNRQQRPLDFRLQRDGSVCRYVNFISNLPQFKRSLVST